MTLLETKDQSLTFSFVTQTRYVLRSFFGDDGGGGGGCGATRAPFAPLTFLGSATGLYRVF